MDHRLDLVAGPSRPRHDDDAGATSVEYAIMVTMIAVVIMVAVAFVGISLRDDYQCSGSAIENPDLAPPGGC